MQRTGIGLLLSIVLLTMAVSTYAWSQAGHPVAMPWTPPNVQVGSLSNSVVTSVVVPTSNQQYVQQMVVYDSVLKSIVVYHIQQDTGVITLKSVRKVDADFALEEFNGADPSPSKIRSVLTSR
ncbi:MAG: hypothetical protein U0905_06000 [Pirellulales bacterium]